MKSLSTRLSNTSELLRDFAWFLDHAEDTHIAEAAELFAHYRRDDCCGLWGAAFALFALCDKYEDEKERKLRMGLAMSCNELAREGAEDQVSFLSEALKRAGYLASWERPKPGKKPIWLTWIDAMDDLDVPLGDITEQHHRTAFAQAALQFAKDASARELDEIHGKLSRMIGIHHAAQPVKLNGPDQPAGGVS